MVITGPVLRFLATREADMLARGEEPQKKKLVFWPFAAAGMTLFGVGSPFPVMSKFQPLPPFDGREPHNQGQWQC